jgi:hypothetical protein
MGLNTVMRSVLAALTPRPQGVHLTAAVPTNCREGGHDSAQAAQLLAAATVSILAWTLACESCPQGMGC